MTKSVIALLVLVSTASTMANTIAKCSLKADGRTETIQLRMDSRGKIIQWDNIRWAKVSTNAYWLKAFSENIEEYGIEWDKSFKARNGYSILEIGTTADSFQVGVNLAESKGYFKYRDIGSGAGNKGPLTMTCK